MNSPNLSTKKVIFLNLLIKMEIFIFIISGMYVQTIVLSMKEAYALDVSPSIVIRGERHGINGD